jgi:predicted permease
MPVSQDVLHAFRSFRSKPILPLAVVSILAVGIGATTAVFSVVDRVLFRPLPYGAAERLVSLGIRIPWLEYDFLTAGSYGDLRRDPGPFAEVTSWSGVADCDWTGDRPARLGCAGVESTFLPVLGVAPALGRNFTPEEDRPGAARVAVISNALWMARFGGDRGAVGRRIEIDGQPTLIVGVLPADFELPSLDRADLLVPQVLPPNPPPGTRPLRVYGRLRGNVSAVQAREAILGRAQQLFSEIPPHMRKQVQFHVIGMRDLQTGEYRAASWTLLAAVLATLWIACANAANLLLARSMARRRELAIRAALGASRARLAGETLTECLLLSLGGGLAGCGLAYGLLRVFVAIAPEGIPALAAASLDARVLLFGVGASLVCGAVFGLAPAFYRPGMEMLSGNRTTSSAGLLARRLLVGAQIAVSLVLLTCAGLLLQSLWNRQSVWLGLRSDGVTTARFVLGPRYGPPSARAAFYEQLEARLGRLPGVESVGLSDSLPPGGTPRSQPIFAPVVEGKAPFDEGTPGIVIWRAVTPDYFRTLGIPIVRGRGFTEDDRRPMERSIILSAAYARRLFGDENPLGRKMSRYPGAARNPLAWYTIVGVAADVRNSGLADRNDPEYYLARRRGSMAYEDIPMASAVVLRGSVNRAAMLRAEIAAMDPALPVVVRSFERHVGELAARPRFQAWLLAGFAGIGMLMAGFGLYGLVAFLVARREREFGVRLALGATQAGILKLVLGDALRWTLGGLVSGLAGAVAAARALGSLLFHVSPADPGVYAMAAVVLITLAMAAAFQPSRRAARVDPATALRQD